MLLEVWRRTGTTIHLVTYDAEEAVYLSQHICFRDARFHVLTDDLRDPLSVYTALAAV